MDRSKAKHQTDAHVPSIPPLDVLRSTSTAATKCHDSLRCRKIRNIEAKRDSIARHDLRAATKPQCETAGIITRLTDCAGRIKRGGLKAQARYTERHNLPNLLLSPRRLET